MTQTTPTRDEAVRGELAQTERRENGLRANMDEVATLAHQMIAIIRRGALRPDPQTGWLTSAPAPASGGVDSAIATIWTAAMAVACNTVIMRQNDLNDDDGPVDVLNEQGAIIAALKKWLQPDSVYLEGVRELLHPADLASLSPAATPVYEAEPERVLLDGGWRTKHDDLLRANGILQSQLRECQEARRKAMGGDVDEIARWKRDSELLSAIQDECWDVRFTNSPNADAGDYNINIEIVGHFMADPQERVVGENYNENLRAALEQAMTAGPYPPARPIYDEPEEPEDAALSQATSAGRDASLVTNAEAGA